MILLKMMFAAAALAVSLALNPPPHRRKRKSHPAPTVSRRIRTESTTLLALRRELLHDFLVQAGTETAAFFDSQIVDGGRGIRIGPTSVDVDFLGAPIIRARVRNASGHSLDILVSANVHDKRGRTEQASTWIERLEPGDSRAVELFCPASLSPNSVDWSVTSL